MMGRKLGLAAAFVALGILVGTASAHGQIYSYVDKNGVRTFTNIPPNADVRDVSVTGRPLPLPAPPPAAADGDAKYDPIIERYAAEYRLDPLLVRSIIATESSFNPRAISPKGARGLMQLMPATAARLGVQNSFDPEQNIRGGTKHFRSLLDTFDNDLELSLAAYNAGENLVQRVGRVPDIRETQNYVRSITRRYGKNQMELQTEEPDKGTPMFRYYDEHGVLHLTNIPPVERPEPKAAAWKSSGSAPE